MTSEPSRVRIVKLQGFIELRGPTQREGRRGRLARILRLLFGFSCEDERLTFGYLASLAAVVLSLRAAFGGFVLARRPVECTLHGREGSAKNPIRVTFGRNPLGMSVVGPARTSRYVRFCAAYGG